MANYFGVEEHVNNFQIPTNNMSKTKIIIDNILKDDIFIIHDTDKIKLLPDKTESTQIHFTKSSSNNWIQNLMENNYYKIEKIQRMVIAFLPLL